MDIQTQKLELIDKILHSTDHKQLAMLNNAMNNQPNEPTNIDKAALQKIYLEKISKAFHDIQSGKTISNNDLKNKTNGW